MSRLFVKLEVSYHQDPKVLDLDDERAELLYVRALTYCKQHLTDGVIHRRAIASFAPFSDQVAPAVLADELVRVGLWKVHERGWMVAAWLDHNKASDDILTSKRGAELAHIRHHAKKGITKAGCEFCEAAESENPQVDAHVCGPQCGAQCGDALPETETETETETEKTLPLHEPAPSGPPPTAARFDEFWQLWIDAKRNKDKPAARSAWRTATKKADPDTIIDAARLYTTAGIDPQYLRYPHRWLRAEAWNEPPPERRSRAGVKPGFMGDDTRTLRSGRIDLDEAMEVTA